MDSGVLDEIHRFTASVEKPDLYAYLDIDPSADRETITHALQVRRSWAQGQQANPKYRQEALWVIKNIGLLKEALIAEASAYKSDLAGRDERAKLDTLSMFIKGTLADGELTARGEEAIQKQAKEMGLPESLVIRRIGEILAEQDAQAMTVETPTKSPVSPVNLEGVDDLYAILDTPPDSDPATLEAAYRRRYRWARQLRDTEQSSRVYAKLDEAWRTLKDPEQRAAYDEERRQATDAGADAASAPDFYLPPPPPKMGIRLPTPSVEQHLERVEAAAQSSTGAPSINMPAASPERPAPPPPSIPDMGQFDDVEDLEEPEVSVEDWSTDDARLATMSMMDLEPKDRREPSPPEDVAPVIQLHSHDTSEPDDTQAPFADLLGAPTPGRDETMGSSLPNTPSEPSFSIPDFQGMADLSGQQPNSDGKADILADMLSLDDLVAGQGFQSTHDALQSSGAADDGLDLEYSSAKKGDVPKGPALDAGQLFNDLAILRVDGPRVVRIRTGSHPFPVRITVRNEGEGSMPGSVSSNVPWMQISPSQLDPNRRTQVVEALVEPDGISGNAAKGIVTIDTLHGESRTVTIDAIKHIVSPVMLFVTALSLVGFIGLFTGLYLSGIIGSSVESPNRTILAVNVDPPAGEVYIDDELVGNQGTMSIVDNFPIGTPFQLRVELDGFEPFVRDIEVNRGDQFRVEVDLELREQLDYEPPEGAQEATFKADDLDAQLEQYATHLDACFTRNLRTDDPYTAEVTVRGVVTARGFIQGLDLVDANFRSPAVETCLQRQLRALKLPLLAGDYARFERRLSVEIRDVSVLNDEAQ